MSVNIFCDPSGGLQSQSVRNDTGGDSGNVFGNCSAILGGIPSASTNNNYGDLSVILMGDTNNINVFGAINGIYNLIGNGYFNTAAGCFNAVVNGEGNNICGLNSFIGGGGGNNICPITVGVGPLGGSSIVGGAGNRINDDGTYAANGSFIGGGYYNCVFGMGSSIVGGGENIICSYYSFIGGGTHNVIHVNSCGSVIAGGGYCDPSRPLVNLGNNIFSSQSFIGSGTCNFINVSSDCSFIGGGTENNVGATGGGGLGSIFSIIGGGQSNCIDDTSFASSYSGIFGGTGNCVGANTSFIGGGGGNYINQSSDNSVISGGAQNRVGLGGFGSTYSVIGGGSSNTIDDTGAATIYSIIGGGDTNCICAGSNSSGIFGGSNHCVNGNNLFVGGGDTNYICSTTGLGPVMCSAIVGGWQNLISDDGTNTADLSFIGGGCQHTIGAIASFIGGGENNLIQPTVGTIKNSVITGGTHNSITDDGTTPAAYSFIGGGTGNNIFGYCSAIVGGQIHEIYSIGSFIGGGDTNTINILSGCSIIAGGQQNILGDPTGTNASPFSFIGGGFNNNIFSVGSSIVGGQNHSIFSVFSFIGGGDTNTINILSDCSFIGGGNINNIGAPGGVGLGSIFSIIGGGQKNCIDDTLYASSYSGIFGGCNHCVNGNNLFAGGGDTNHIFSGLGPVSCSTIVGGWLNTISDDGVTISDLSFIGGGYNNGIRSIASSIAGGQENCIYCNAHLASGTVGFSFIGGGKSNNVGVAGGSGAAFSVIGGGESNTIDDTGIPTVFSIIGGGNGNTIGPGADGGSIFSGQGNQVTGLFSSILGGFSNNLSGACSSILGGSGNSDGGFNWAGVFGCNITAVCSCAFHANQFVAQNMYDGTFVAPAPGSKMLYYCNFGPGNCQVFIA